MSVGARRSIVYQLWLRLSTLTFTFALLALGAYLWLAIDDNIENAHERAEDRSLAISTAMARLVREGLPPSQEELAAARNLDMEIVQLISPTGEVVQSIGPLTGEEVPEPVTGEMLASGEVSLHHDVRVADGGYGETSVNPLKLLLGGSYGAEHYFPITMFEPGETGGIRVVASYGDLAGEARTLLFRSLALTGGILGVAVFGMWVLLNNWIARPLRVYSDTVMRIAAGDPVRMPSTSRDELGQLGRAVNGMADALQHQATVDPLTGLYNLRHLTSRLETLIEEAKRTEQPLALVVCDLDNLKEINDTYGHQAGDTVLVAVAKQFLAWAGGDYTCWRLGGDEFAAAMPNTTAEKAEAEAQVLEDTIDALVVTLPGGVLRQTSISIGLALYPHDSNAPGGTLLGIADRRMYESKAAKANRPRVVDVAPAA